MSVTAPRKSDLRLLNAFIELVETHDLDRISTRTLINQAGIARSTFYRHYADKTAFYDWVMSYLLGQFQAENFPQTTPMAFYTNYFSWFQRYRKAFKAFIIHDKWRDLTQKMIDNGVAIYRGILSHINTPNVPITALSAYIISAHIGVAIDWIRQDNQTPLQEMAAQLTSMTTAVLAAYNIDIKRLFGAPKMGHI